MVPAGYKKDIIFSNVETPNECAKICLQAKFCSCTSFSFNKGTNECIMSDRLVVRRLAGGSQFFLPNIKHLTN